MIIVIDAYNLLKQLFRRQITQKERGWFESFAAEYARKKQHTLYLVFDGGPFTRPTAERTGSVIIVYSGTKETADDVIKAYIDERTVAEMLLVTTDRQLNRYASQQGIPSLDSLDFYALMKETAKKEVSSKKTPSKAHKVSERESPELDLLMEQGASMPYFKEEEVGGEKLGKTPAKMERRILALLKKL